MVAKLLGSPETQIAPPTVISEETGSDAQIVLALFETRCYECHGATKQKGKLRLDTPEGIASVVLAGDPSESELFRRISLAHDDFDIMPPEGGPLTDADVLAVMRWIRGGAEVAPVEIAPEVMDQKPASDAELIDRLRSDLGAAVTELPESGDLSIDLSLGDGAFQANQLAELKPIADRVVELSLAGRTISGEIGGVSFPHLARLRLERSNADDAFVKVMLERAPTLETLNLHSTSVTDGIVGAIVRSPSLKQVVLFGTALSADALWSLRTQRPTLSVEAGEELADAFVVSGGPREILAADYSSNRIAALIARDLARTPRHALGARDRGYPRPAHPPGREHPLPDLMDTARRGRSGDRRYRLVLRRERDEPRHTPVSAWKYTPSSAAPTARP